MPEQLKGGELASAMILSQTRGGLVKSQNLSVINYIYLNWNGNSWKICKWHLCIWQLLLLRLVRFLPAFLFRLLICCHWSITSVSYRKDHIPKNEGYGFYRLCCTSVLLASLIHFKYHCWDSNLDLSFWSSTWTILEHSCTMSDTCNWVEYYTALHLLSFPPFVSHPEVLLLNAKL